MRHPAEYWIKFLLSRDMFSYEQIGGMCEMIELGAAQEEYIQAVHEELQSKRPVPFRPIDRKHKASQTYLRKEGIHEAWHRTYAMRQALGILGTNKVRSLVETFILSPLKPEQAVKKLKERLDYNLSVKGYDCYRHYFWNNALLSSTDWGTYIRNRQVSHREWLRLAVAARGPEGVQLLLWKTGTGGLRQMTAGKIFEDIRNIAYMKIKEIEMHPAHLDHSQTFLNYARVAKLAQEEVANNTDAMRDVLASFQAFRMRHAEVATPSVSQLTGGNVTEAEDVTGASDEIEY